MGYAPNIPAANDNPSVSQGQIQTNFGVLNTSNNVNHVTYSTTGQGKHKFVEMPNQGSIPTPLVAGEGTIYTKSVGGVSQLFYTPDNSGNEYQLSRSVTADFPSLGANPGWTYLPGGLLLQYGTVTSPGGSGTITFPVPYTNIPYSVTFGLQRASGSSAHVFYVVTGTLGTGGFTYNSDTTGSVAMYWMALGV